jgi:hypothetical protein
MILPRWAFPKYPQMVITLDGQRHNTSRQLQILYRRSLINSFCFFDPQWKLGEFNRVMTKSYQGDTSGTPAVNYFYDAQTVPTLPAGAPTFTRGSSTGRLEAVIYGTGNTRTYQGYDQMGRVVQSIQVTETQATGSPTPQAYWAMINQARRTAGRRSRGLAPRLIDRDRMMTMDSRLSSVFLALVWIVVAGLSACSKGRNRTPRGDSGDAANKPRAVFAQA